MDTQKITQELLSTGLTQQQLADLTSCSQAAISAFARGKRGSRLSLSIGLRLLALHQERCQPYGCEIAESQVLPASTELDTASENSACGGLATGSQGCAEIDVLGQAHANI